MKSRLDRVIMTREPTSIVVTLTLAEARVIRDSLEIIRALAQRRAEPVFCKLEEELRARLSEAERPLQNAGRF